MKAMLTRIGDWCFNGLAVVCISLLVFLFSVSIASWPTAQYAINRHAARLADHEQRLRDIERERLNHAVDPLAAIEPLPPLESLGAARAVDGADPQRN